MGLARGVTFEVKRVYLCAPYKNRKSALDLTESECACMLIRPVGDGFRLLQVRGEERWCLTGFGKDCPDRRMRSQTARCGR